MQDLGFFQTTRGHIVESLKRAGPRTAVELAREHGLTANAVRQHLARLERDGYVAERPVRRGKTKPSFLYSLTGQGDNLFPQRYSALLRVVLGELSREEGPERVQQLFRRIGERSARKYAGRFAGKDTAGRVGELTKILQERGVIADFQPSGDGFVLREHNCPFKDAVAEHPQICAVVHTLMDETLPERVEHVTSIARGDEVCEFRIGNTAETAASNADVTGGSST